MDRRLRTFALLCLAACLTVAPAAAQQNSDLPDRLTQASGHTAVLRALNKITARTTDLTVPVGGTARFGNLAIQVDYCRTRPPIEPPETYVLMVVRDRPPDRPVVEIFNGWMLASMPSLNPLEHPVYDLWVIGCQMDGDPPKE